jgi:cobalamin biosynthesis protein CobD/CbiB
MKHALALGWLLAMGAGPALAHPHVWIDTKIEVILNDRNEATGVRSAGPMTIFTRSTSWETWALTPTGTAS